MPNYLFKISKADLHLWLKAPTLWGKLWSPAYGRGSLTCKNGRMVLWEPSRLHKITDILPNYFLISQPPLSHNTTKKLFPPLKKIPITEKKWWPIKRLFLAPNTSDGWPFCHQKTWFTIRLTSHIDFTFYFHFFGWVLVCFLLFYVGFVLLFHFRFFGCFYSFIFAFW